MITYQDCHYKVFLKQNFQLIYHMHFLQHVKVLFHYLFYHLNNSNVLTKLNFATEAIYRKATEQIEEEN